jgi:hypothetical protein
MSNYSEADLERQIAASTRRGRTVEIRVRIKPQIKRLLLACATKEEETMTRIIESAIRDYAAKNGVTIQETN